MATVHSEQPVANPETVIQQRVRLALGQLRNVVTFRNNTGSAIGRDGRPVRFGLCEGSADLIGWTTRTITAEDVGQPIAVFTAIEIKTDTGRLTCQQKDFLAAVERAGGIAGVARCEEDAIRLVTGQS
jgi:hypothetical protein